MSDSDSSKLVIDTSRALSSKSNGNKLKRPVSGLEILPTEEESNYRSNFNDVNVIHKFPDLIKCTKCHCSFKSDILAGKKIHSHPLLKVLMCKSCCIFYGNGEFSLDEDGEDKYCRWCGEGGKLFLCSECICGFCPTCIKRHFGKDIVKQIKNDDEWMCFFCNPKPLWKLRTVCFLAKKQAQLNKQENNVERGKTPRKRPYPNSRQSKENNFDCLENNEGTDDRGISDCEENSGSSQETEVSQVSGIGGKRKLRAGSNAKGEMTTASGREGSDDSEIPVKRRRSARLTRRGERVGNRKVNVKHGSDTEFSSDSSITSEDEENDSIGVTNALGAKKSTEASKIKPKHIEKLRDLLRVAETTAELCLKMCRKRIKKLDSNSLACSKVLSQCEKLKSMVILMSCSLSTVHNLILSLQQKCKVKENLDSAFHRKQESALLEEIGKILLQEKAKPSHFICVVNDILNRYPFFEAGAKHFNNSVISFSKINKRPITDTAGSINDGTCQNIRIKCDRVCDENNESPPTRTAGSAMSENKVSPDDNADHEKSACESDTSTVVFELDNINGIENKNGVPGEEENERKVGNPPPEENRPVSDASPDMETMYRESMRLKEQLLRSSSDEISSDEEESGISNLSRVGSESRKSRNVKKGLLTVKMEMSQEEKEEKELSRLMNLSFLEREKLKETRARDSRGAKNSKDKVNEPEKVEDSDKVIRSDASSDSGCSESELPSTNRKHDENYLTGTECIKQYALILKSYFLKTSSSDDSLNEESSSDVDVKKKREKVSARKTGRKEKTFVKNKPGSEWKSSRLLRGSLSISDSDFDFGSDILKPSSESKESSEEDKSSDEIKVTDGSSTDSVPPTKVRKKRKQMKLVTTTSESSSSDTVTFLGASCETKSESPTKGRREIKKILRTGNLQLETRQAVKMENERKKRVAEKNEIYNKLFPNMAESERLVLDFDRNTKEVLLEVPIELASKLKPHQKEGIKFMWDCCFESMDNLDQSNGSGCVLAHCMGLGKTLQIITLTYTVMTRGAGVETVLVLCPLNVVGNWVYEFQVWLKDLDSNIDVYHLNHIKRNYLRYLYLKRWHTDGGIMIVSYDLMRRLTSTRKMTKKGTDIVLLASKFLLNPGPDLVVCDEGHLLKNQGTALSQSIMKIRTSRRIILTGTPLQNNLLEYHSMVQFIKPNVLGTKREFMNRFGNPIMNGQFEDSTARDVKLMRARSHVLHKLLDGCIQRFNYSVLTPYLPEKHEYVISIRLTESQAKTYQSYVDKCRTLLKYNKTAKLFKDFHFLQRVWTHPRVLAAYIEKHNELGENFEDSFSSGDSVICLQSEEKTWNSGKINIKEVIRPEECEDIHSSGKLVLLFHILSMCRKIGDKVLVFSQSLSNLNLIEYFLRKIDSATKSGSGEFPPQYGDTWEEGVDYYRMEGSTSYENRTKWCRHFNNKNNKRSRLFLISTKAGGLGINLIGANRVIIFDVSWNPSHDVQSIFRVYRFGQLKTCYIYRFVAEGTMEEKIYARQVTKLSLEKRVLDEHQIERHYTMGNLQELYSYDPIPKEKWTVPMVPKDKVLAEILNNKDIIVSYHEHDSLLENKIEEELTEEERKAAWDDFEREKFATEQELLNRTETNLNNGNARTSGVSEIERIIESEFWQPPFRYPAGIGTSGFYSFGGSQFGHSPSAVSTDPVTDIQTLH